MKKTIHFVLGIVFATVLLPYLAFAQTANIYIGSTDQTIRGFGGMNFPRWIPDLTTAQVDKAFGNGAGQIGLSILRVSVSPNSSQWNLEVPTAQRAKSLGAIVFATPWSPPASMKTNGSVVQGQLRTDQYGAYANHLRDFTNYMSSNGASLYAISVQNEPDWLPDYESCGWSGSQIRTFLDNNASVIPTRVIAPETVHYKADYMNAIASSSHVDILANHAYGGSPTRFNSSKEQWMTEHYAPNSNSNSANNWPEALGAGKEIHDYMINGYNAYIWWYIRRSYGLITEDGNISKRGYVMSHFSKFVRPGYVRVRADAAPTSVVSISSYQSGNTLVIVAINQNSSSRSITFNFSGNNVSNITKWETTGSVNVAQSGTYSGGTSLTNTLAGNSISTFRGTIGGGGGTTSYVQLQNRGTGLRLDGMGRTTNGSACGQYGNTTHVNSHWEMIDVGGGYYQLRNRGTGLLLDGMGRTSNGSDVGQWANTTHQNSHWSLQQYDGNYYRLQNRATGLYLDGMGRTSNGANCGQYANTTHVNAQWQLISVSSSARFAFEAASQESEQESTGLFFSNPVKETLTIQRGKDEVPASARIFNISGQLMISTDLPEVDSKINVNGLSQGVYLLEIVTPSEIKRSKLIKQ